MDNHTYQSNNYGGVAIRCNEKVWNTLADGTREKLAALIQFPMAKEHFTTHSSDYGEGAEGYVHNYGNNQIASFKDIGNPPKTVTVLKTGTVNNGQHTWD